MGQSIKISTYLCQPLSFFYFPSMLTHPSLKRRSHLNRRQGEAGVQVTELDIRDIFEPLSRHARLSTRQLVAFGSRYPTITKGRLGKLWHATARESSHWLHRANEELVFANHLYIEDLHRLGDEAEGLLVERGLIPDEPWVAASRIGGRSKAATKVARLAHDHMASDIAIDIEIGVRTAGGAFRSHLDLLAAASEGARCAKYPLRIPLMFDGSRTYIEPDALFAVGDQVYALEADKGTETISTVIVDKIRKYREAIASFAIDDWFCIDNLTILFATPSAARMKRVMAELQAIARGGKSARFGFFADPAFAAFMQSNPPTGRLAKLPWVRVGYPDLILVGDKV